MANPLCHWELMVSDVEKAKAFYAKVLGWRFQDAGMGGYAFIDTGKEPGGGIMAKPAQAPGCSLNNYFDVDDIEETLKKVEAAGGRRCYPKMEIPGIGWHSMFIDPDGICVGIFQHLEKKA